MLLLVQGSINIPHHELSCMSIPQGHPILTLCDIDVIGFSLFAYLALNVMLKA